MQNISMTTNKAVKVYGIPRPTY